MTALAFDILGRDKASGAFDKVSKSAEKTERRFGFLAARSHGLTAGMTAGFGKIAAAMGAVAGVAVFKDFIDEARESRKVGALTESIIKSTGGAAKISAKQVGALATAISNKTGVDDEAIQSGSNLLLTFKNVRNEVGKGAKIFDRATQAAVDLSAAGFGDIAGASKMLGKALNDPLKGLTALGKAGVTFTEQQKKQIKTLVETGNVLGAQKIILKEVESQVGGAAAAAADPMAKLSVIIGNVKETIGTALLPAVDKAATWLGNVLPVAVDKSGKFFTGRLLPPLRAVAGFVQDRVLPVVSDIIGTFAGLGGRLVRAIGPIDLGKIADDIWTGASKWAGKLIGGLRAGIDKGDWKPLGTAVGDAIVNGLKGLSTITGRLLDTLGELLDKVDWGKLGSRISGGILGMLRSVDWKRLGDALGDAVITIVQKASSFGEKLGRAFKDVITRIDWQKVGRESTDAIGQFIVGIDWKKLSKTLGIAVLKSLKINKSVLDALNKAATDLVIGIFNSISAKVEEGRVWLVGKTKELGSFLISGLKSGVVSGMKGIGSWLKGVIVDPVVNSVKSFFGVRSPSTVFASIGQQLIAGLRGGIAAGVRGIGAWIYRTVIAPSITPFARAGSWLVQGGRNAVAGYKAGISAIAGGIGRWVYGQVISPTVAPFGKAGRWLYSAGRNVIAGFKNGMVSIWGSVTSWVGGIATWIRDHKGPVSLDGRLLIPAGQAIMSGFLKGLKSGAGPAWNFVKSVGGKTVSALQALYGGIGSTSLGTVGSGVERWRGIALQALKLTHSPASWVDSLLRRMQRESGGNPSAINLWDINAKHGDPSRGLMQVIGSTFSAYKRPGIPQSSIWDPLENIVASINYANARYGAAPRGWDKPGGYKLGTPWVPNDQLAFLHKGEGVIPADVNRARLRAGSGASGDVHIHLHGTEQQLMDQLVRKLDDLRRQGRLRVA